MGGPGPCGGKQPVAALRFAGLPGIELVECDGDPTQFTPATAAHPTGDGYRLLTQCDDVSDSKTGYCDANTVGENHPEVQKLFRLSGLSGLRGSYPAIIQQLQQLPLAILRNPAGDPLIKIDLIHRGVADWSPEDHEAVRQAMQSDPDVRVRAYATARLRNLESISVAAAEETFCACLQQAKATQLAAVLQVIPSLDAYSDALWHEVFRILTGDGVILEDFQAARALVLERSREGWIKDTDQAHRLLSALMVAARYDRRAEIRMAALDTIKLINLDTFKLRDSDTFVELVLERMQMETDPPILEYLFVEIRSWMYLEQWGRFWVPILDASQINRLIDGLLRLQMIGKWKATMMHTPLEVLAFIAEIEPDFAGPARAKAVDLARKYYNRPHAAEILSHWGHWVF